MSVVEGGPVVEAATVCPGHDGRAELVVALRHPNGATSTISLDEDALGELLASGVVTSLDDLPGRRWADLTTTIR
jgi:hypothetical protein